MNVQETIGGVPHISVCICTFRRPGLLKRLLDGLGEQDPGGSFTFSILVVDNDQAESAKRVVEEFTATSPMRVAYFVEPRQNIALARNKAIENATGDYIAFIDDDEFPGRDWLRSLFTACQKYEASGVLGPVRPHYSQSPPEWLAKGRFAERPTYPTGHVLTWNQSRTGNVLFRKEIIQGQDPVFRTQFGTGGEDVDFFERMMKKGCIFVWCKEAEVFEEVPGDRCTRKYHIRRALLRGSNSARREGYRVLSVVKSVIALPTYGVLLPFLFVIGHHHFMKYAIKFFDHTGKLLSLLGFTPVTDR